MTDARSAQRREWMVAAQSGDTAAYEAFLHDMVPLLTAYLRRRVRRPEDAEDVLQDALVNLHRSRHTYDPARLVEPWAFTIARHAAIDYGRRMTNPGRHDALDDVPHELADRADVIDGLIDFSRALEALPAAQREAFALVQVDGMSVEGAAGHAGTTVGALKVRAHRAYKKLRAHLA